MLKKILKRTFQILLLAFIVIQFIRPTKNKAEGISNNDISKRLYCTRRCAVNS